MDKISGHLQDGMDRIPGVLDRHYNWSDMTMAIEYDSRADLDEIRLKVAAEVDAAGLNKAIQKIRYYSVELKKLEMPLIEKWKGVEGAVTNDEHSSLALSEVEHDLKALLYRMELEPNRWSPVPEEHTTRFDEGYTAAIRTVREAICGKQTMNETPPHLAVVKAGETG
jgi:hypothetical protein